LKPLSQNELVDQFLAGTDKDREVTDPNLGEHFHKLPGFSKGKVKTDQFKLAGLKELHTRSRADISATLLSVLEIKRGIVAFQWTLGSDFIKVDYIDGFEQKKVPEPQRIILEEILTTTLKMRNNVRTIKWELGKDCIEVSYIVT
jgi:hypothetical protein